MTHDSLSKIMDHLMKMYEQGTLVEYMHDKVKDPISMHYDPNAPVDTVFSAVDKFCHICILIE